MKKKIPLEILEALQPFVNKNLDFVTPLKDDTGVFHLKDNDENSDFYFKVVKQELRNARLMYQVVYKPKNNESVVEHTKWTPVDNVSNLLNDWLQVLLRYNEVHTIYDDPIIKANQERFESQFEIIDEDADYASFNYEQQLYLDQYLANVQDMLIDLQEGRDPEEKEELQVLIVEAAEIKKNLTKESKRRVIKRIARLFAKAQKVGLDVIKKIFVNIVTEIGKKMLTGGQ